MWEQGAADAGVSVQPGEAGQEQQQGLLQGGQAGRSPTQQEAQEGQSTKISLKHSKFAFFFAKISFKKTIISPGSIEALNVDVVFRGTINAICNLQNVNCEDCLHSNGYHLVVIINSIINLCYKDFLFSVRQLNS